MGPQGPAGPPAIASFVYLYHLGAGSVPANGNVTFDAAVPTVPNAPISVPNDHTILISSKGFYEVLFRALSMHDQRRLELRINGVGAPGGISANFTSGADIDGKLIIEITHAQLPANITLVNISPDELDYSVSGANDVTAMIEILKLR